MKQFDEAQLAEVFATYPAGVPTFHDGSADDPRLPESWRVVASASDPQTRRRAAFENWNADFLERLPQFAAAKDAALIDVRVIDVADEPDPWMLYAFECADGELGVWTGFSPASFGESDPPFFDALPAPVQIFLRTVHAGFAAEDAESFGLTPPRFMMTAAQWLDSPDGVPGWEDVLYWGDLDVIDSRRLMRVTGTPSGNDLYVSPDISVGEVVCNRDGEVEVADFFDELDVLMAVRLER